VPWWEQHPTLSPVAKAGIVVVGIDYKDRAATA